MDAATGVGSMKFEGKLEGREYRPRLARVDVKYDALVRFERTTVEAKIFNVSREGFRLHAAEALQTGMEVTLEVEQREPVRGQICWTRGQDSGGVFLEAIAL